MDTGGRVGRFVLHRGRRYASICSSSEQRGSKLLKAEIRGYARAERSRSPYIWCCCTPALSVCECNFIGDFAVSIARSGDMLQELSAVLEYTQTAVASEHHNGCCG